MRGYVLGLLLLWSAPALAQTAPTVPQVMQQAVGSVIRPAMLDFKSRASGLDSALHSLCLVPAENTLAIAAQQFQQTALAYGRIEYLRLGPLMEENRVDRLLFFPDRKGIGLKQVQAILASEDPSASTLDSLKGKSVAAQGFGALEFVLFGTGFETLTSAEGAFRCAYGQAIAANIAEMASEIAEGWFTPGGIADHLLAPKAEYADYRSEREALEELVGQVSHGIEAVRDARISPFIAQGDDAAKPKLALFWRAGLTVPMIRANVDGMRRLVAVSGMARAVAAKDVALDNSIAFEFSNAERALDLITLPVEQAVADPKQVQALNYLVIVTQSLQSLMGEQLSTALGLSVGFSSLDGD